MSPKQSAAREIAERIRTLGFRVWLAERGTYGFFTNAAGDRVVSFGVEDVGGLCGNYGPPSTQSGTGWRIEQSPFDLKSVEQIERALNERPPLWCGNGWKYLTSLDQYLALYGASSRFTEVEPV